MNEEFDLKDYDKEKIKNIYNDYYKTKDFKSYFVSEKYFIRSLISKNSIQFGAKILDIGCGTGKYTNLFTEFGMDCLGIDISKSGIEQAKEKFPASRFVIGDVTDMNFSKESINVIFCSGLSLFNETNLDNLLPFVKYLVKFLAKGGLFVFIKTTRLTDKFSKNNTRFDYSLESYLSFFNKIKELTLVDTSATYPQIFPVFRDWGFSNFITEISTLNTKLTGIGLRVCIVLRKG